MYQNIKLAIAAAGTLLGFATLLPGSGAIDDVNYAVPEPLTILGSGMALGFGALFKKQQSKKQKKN
ncbi:MAG: PEP-CTERM sorting domain-containing protein [Coleofasciculus sp. C1-SOL-03]|uniref:PEP-CTERM sorting domain-containing protein n=1 Tax=Coleofasciculus sp. C1-SOL-03 TaxID=3069522 RepID=UPI0032FD34BD